MNNQTLLKISERNWEIFWEIPDCPPFLTAEPARMFTRGMKKFCGKNFSDCILEYQNNNNIWYLDGDEWSKFDKVLFDRIIRNPRWGAEINTIVEKHCYPCLAFLDTLRTRPLRQLSDKALYALYKQFMQIYIPAHGSGHPANVLEMKNQRLSNYLKKYLQQKIWNFDYHGTPDECFSLLTAPTEDMSAQKEAKSFFKIADLINKNKAAVKLFKKESTTSIIRKLSQILPAVWRVIKLHQQNWCWTVFNYEGPDQSLEQYIENWRSFFRQAGQAQAESSKLKKERASLVKQQKNVIKMLQINSKHQRLLTIASNVMFLKALRKDCMYKGAWASEPLYAEIGRRLGITTHEARYIFYFEMKKALVQHTFNSKILRERIKEVVVHQRVGKPDIVLGGKRAISFIQSLKIKKPDLGVKELRGQCAYPGKVVGKVKLVNTPEMMDKMKTGDILMAYATQPNLLPAMRKAAAFITDFGGITCHAAIVAREWKVPCIIGTGNATKILKDDELVEVDAGKGLVRRLSK